MAVKVVTDSTSYIPLSLRDSLDISVVSLSISFAAETFLEEEIDHTWFYEKMAASSGIPASSQPSIQDLYTVFKRHICQGNAVVGIFLSSEMSGTYSTALTVRGMILEHYPDAIIEIIDSRSNSMQLGFAVLAGAKSAQAGDSLEQVIHDVYEVMKRSRFLFIPQTLDYLKKGGRIGGASHLLGTVLKIKPILTVINGKTALLDRIRTTERAIQEILKIFYQDVQQKGLAEAVVHHINDERCGIRVAQMIAQDLGREIPVYPIGPVIGAHVGPGTLGIAYYTREEL